MPLLWGSTCPTLLRRQKPVVLDMTMLNFCTLYNSNYAAKGLAMYYSLVKHCPSFHLYIFAFDDRLAEAMKTMSLPHITVVTLKEFEDQELLAIKSSRTTGEYCWTCSGSTILYCLEQYHLDACTYIDADLYFFSDPTILINEMGDDDVLITAHRYTSAYDQTATSGKYCVQFMTFKNTENGLHVLRWWRNACLEWCYNRIEDGKFGDQKYLDDWTIRFKGIHELQHLGGGVAPWNMQQYTFRREGDSVIGTELSTEKDFELVFFHFHDLLCFKKGAFREFSLCPNYILPKSAKDVVYSLYLPVLKCSYVEMKKMNSRIDGLATKLVVNKSFVGWVFKFFKRSLLNYLNNGRYMKYSHWIKS